MYRAPDLRARLVELARLPPAERWQPFERLIADLFKRGHFRIERNSRAAGARQVDLAVSRRGAVYLVEVKWKSEPIDVGDLDGLYARLDGTPPATTGLLISPTGFTSGLRDEVVRRKSRPVLLVGPQELREALDDPRIIAQMLQRKLEHFSVTGGVLAGPNTADFSETHGSTWGLREPFFVDANGIRLRWAASGGGYGEVVFAQELADVDWVPSGGRGVCLDLRPQAETQDDVTNLVEELVAQGWLSVGATWVIEQIDTDWHGLGWSTFIDAITDWRVRYEPLGHLHHTEQFCITDSLDGRLLVLSGDLSAREHRICYSMNLSFHLQGVPLDPEPFTHLAEEAGDNGPLYWRPLDQRSVETTGLRGRDEVRNADLVPVALVVEEDPGDDRDPVWVRGIVIRNLFQEGTPGEVDPLLWPAGIRESEFVVCSLRHGHPFGDTPERYDLHAVEWANTTQFSVVRVIADWQGQLTQRDGTPRGHPRLSS